MVQRLDPLAGSNRNRLAVQGRLVRRGWKRVGLAVGPEQTGLLERRVLLRDEPRRRPGPLQGPEVCPVLQREERQDTRGHVPGER